MGLQNAIWANRLRIFYLITLMPILVFFAIIIGIWWQYGDLNQWVVIESLTYTWVSLPLILLWFFIAVFFQKQIIFSFSGAKEITRKEHPEIYNIVENLCISRGLPIPKIGILEDDSLNAFATGWTPKNSWIVFSRGILKKLDSREIEAVAWHELTHIINGDVKVMVLTNVFIGIIATIGEILMRTGRTKSSNGKWWNPLPLIWLILYLLGMILFPLMNLAISRRKEFLADAGSVELTHDKDAMILALAKISDDAVIESIAKNSVAQMCIANPFSKTGNTLKNLFSTHPSIESRIEALKNY